LTRFITLIATATLAAGVLFRFSSDHRRVLSFIVSMAAVMLAVRSLSAGKILCALLFLSVLGIFTPFRSSQLSHALISVLDLATLALFAVSPMMLRRSRAVALNAAEGKL
jgi:uncharacterized protein DUF6804